MRSGVGIFFWMLLWSCFSELLAVRVASYNVHNYLVMDRRVDDVWRTEYPKPEAALRSVRAVICEAAADVLAIQEIGGLPFLNELQSDLRSDGLDYPFAYICEADDEQRRTAILSRLEPISLACHDDLEFSYEYPERTARESIKRGLLQATFAGETGEWHLFVVHFKSRFTSNPIDPMSSDRRNREATAARNFIRRQFGESSGVNYLIVGDFNDYLDTPVVERFLEVSGRTIAELVPCRDSRGEAWTFHYRRRDVYERVDFIIASPSMATRLDGRAGGIIDRLPDSFRASDHRLIYADFNF